MQLVLSTHCIGDQKLTRDDLAAIAEGGVKYIEIGNGQIEFTFGNTDYLESIQKALDDFGLEVVSVHSPHGNVPRQGDLGGLAEVTRQKGVHTIELAAKTLNVLKGRILTLHPGEWFFCWDEKPDHILALKKSIKQGAEICARYGAKLAIETMRPDEPRIGDDYHDLLEIVSNFNSEDVGLCLDTNHANLNWDLSQLIHDTGGRLMSIHVSDNDGQEERHWLPFSGVIDWKGVSKALVSIDYKGPLVYEVKNSEKKPLREFVRNVVQNYNDLIAMIY